MSTRSVLNSVKGSNMQYLATRLRQLVGARCQARPTEWWAYFGSFGDDFFSEED